MVKRDWLRYDKTPEQTVKTKVIMSLDIVSKDGLNSDYSVCATFFVIDKHFYLVDLMRGRFEYPELKRRVLALAERHKPTAILIEDASAGNSQGR